MSDREQRLDKAVVDAIRARDTREQGYRAQSLKIHPWVCGRCGREFNEKNLHELTVHHKDHNHDNNPLDGSNWELLCLYCHDHEHAKYLDAKGSIISATNELEREHATGKPFAKLKDLLNKK